MRGLLPEMDRMTQSIRFAFAVAALAMFSSPASFCAAQYPAATTPAVPSAATRPPAPPVPVSALLQTSLDTVRGTLNAVRIEKWKRGNIREEAGQNISQIQRNLQVNLPPLLRDADATPASLSKMLPVSRNISALYDVLLRVVEAARVTAPDDQVAQLQQALVTLGNARLALGDRMQSSADAMEKQVTDLRATIQEQAARREVVPVPVVVPCAPATPHRTTRKTTRKPAATSTGTSSSGTQQKSTSGNQQQNSH